MPAGIKKQACFSRKCIHVKSTVTDVIAPVLARKRKATMALPVPCRRQQLHTLPFLLLALLPFLVVDSLDQPLPLLGQGRFDPPPALLGIEPVVVTVGMTHREPASVWCLGNGGAPPPRTFS